MKFDLTDTNAAITASKTFDTLFPSFGDKAPDVPNYDSEKKMFIVGQYTTKGGNRAITYLSVGRQLVIEVTIVFYYSWTLLSNVRVMVPDGKCLKVVKTFDWPLTTYYGIDILRDKIEELTLSYVSDNSVAAGGPVSCELRKQVSGMVREVLTRDLDAVMRDNGREVLKAYCRQMDVCRDYFQDKF